jgi:CheY-like chemotaxis protein
MRIAYVEDNPTNQALVERVARMTHHRIIPFSEGEIALEALQQEQFDLILMDVELAGKVNGLDVVRMLRGQGVSTPIIAVTAYAMMGDRERCLAAGCNDYLPKPIPIKDLLAMLERYEALVGDGKGASPTVLPPQPSPPTPAPDVSPMPELTGPEPAAPVADATQPSSPQVQQEPPVTAASVAEIVQPAAESASPEAAPPQAVDPVAQSNAPTPAVAPAAVVDPLPEPAPAAGLPGPPPATQQDQG